MITIILLAIIYLAFISLGLPDSILGVSIPAMQYEWNLGLSTGGAISMIIAGSTIISSFTSGFVIKKLGTSKTTFISALITGIALLGFSLSPAWYYLLLLALPLGLGAGSVDTALNNYVALHYKAHHMNWLHAFWGVGATLGPLIISYNIESASWRTGYRTIALMQLSLAAILLISMPLWKKTDSSSAEEPESEKTTGIRTLLKQKSAPAALLTMLFYCGAEVSVGLWGSSYLINSRDFPMETAASWMAMYYGGITAGRLISGFVSFRLTNTQMIRIGVLTSLTGIILLLLPLPLFITGLSIVLIGLGFAPVFPSMLHETPERFGKENSQMIIGWQMGFGYIGAAFVPPLLGVVLQQTGVGFFPFIILGFIIMLVILSETLAGKAEHKIQS